MSQQQHTNRLINEKSPYLLQHAHNPVDWYPWGEEAFKKAKEENKPIFLSIGYATCHWCHVMERESFENTAVAAYLNEHFVAVKVDREERPDVDMTYMSAVQAMTGQGGWPLTVFLTPELEPFYGGTYFPPESKYGRPGFIDLLHQIHNIWMDKRGDVFNYAAQVSRAIQENERKHSAGAVVNRTLLDSAYAVYKQQFDTKYGGFGSAPKFPRPMDIQFLLRYHRTTEMQDAMKMATLTLDKMAAGGMYDQIGGGFHRYATDQRWLVPHFEKMLYDNALLAMAYTEAFQVTKNPKYKKVVKEILNFVGREMSDQRGGFYSAQDADSEGEEGKYYVWSDSELRKNLSAKEYQVWRLRYGVSETGNFEHNTNIFYLQTPIDEIVKRTGQSPAEITKYLDRAKEKLLALRKQRIKPLTDDKVLTSWSALMISAYTRAYAVFGEPEFLHRGEKALQFIRENMVRENRLFHRYRDGNVDIHGFLEDYAFFIQALIDAYEVTFDLAYLQQAVTLTKQADELFWDKNGGSYFFSIEKQKNNLVRMKDGFDGAVPSGNSVMALNLLRLSEYTMNNQFRQNADIMLDNFAARLQQSPLSFAQMLLAIDFKVRGANEIVFVLSQEEKEGAEPFLHILQRGFYPNRVVALVNNSNRSAVTGLIPWSKDRQSINGKTTAYICRNFTCRLPTTDVTEFARQLNE